MLNHVASLSFENHTLLSVVFTSAPVFITLNFLHELALVINITLQLTNLVFVKGVGVVVNTCLQKAYFQCTFISNWFFASSVSSLQIHTLFPLFHVINKPLGSSRYIILGIRINHFLVCSQLMVPIQIVCNFTNF